MEKQLEEFDKGATRLEQDPEGFRKEADAAARKANPAITEEQLDASWEQVKHQFGL